MTKPRTCLDCGTFIGNLHCMCKRCRPCQGAYKKACMRAYYERNKAKYKAYQKTAKFKAYKKAYQKTAKFKAYQKAYYERNKKMRSVKA